MKEPLVSIIIPFYKGEKFISETLESIFLQNYPNIEIIVVNDGSPKESLLPLESYKERIKIISQENKGIASARNTGIQYAKGSIVGLIDQDDIWPPERLKKTLVHLTPESTYGFVRGLTKAFQTLPDGTLESSEPTLLPVLVGSALYKKTTIETVGMFDETMREGDDFDWNVRLAETGIPWKEIPEITLLYRKHGNNHSITNGEFVRRGLLVSAKKKLERLRAKNKENKISL